MGFDAGVVWFITGNVFKLNSARSLREHNFTKQS